MPIRVLVCLAVLCAASACRGGEAAGAEVGGAGLRVVILGDAADARIAPVREAIGYWNGELARLGLGVRLDSGVVADVPLPEDALGAASRGKRTPWGWWMEGRLLSELSDAPGDIVIALSRTDLLSFSVPLRGGRKGVVGVRRADVLPLSRPNTVRNVVAHELGHVLGLEHNADSTALMCGRPASCRPTVFASDSARFFPLTAGDEGVLRRGWR